MDIQPLSSAERLLVETYEKRLVAAENTKDVERAREELRQTYYAYANSELLLVGRILDLFA